MRTSASRLVAPRRPRPRRTSRSRSSAAARRLPTSTSVRAGSSPAPTVAARPRATAWSCPCRGRRRSAAGRRRASRTRCAAASQSGSASATRAGRTSEGHARVVGNLGPGTRRFDHAPRQFPAPAAEGTITGWTTRRSNGCAPRSGRSRRTGAQLRGGRRGSRAELRPPGRPRARGGRPRPAVAPRRARGRHVRPHLAVEQAARLRVEGVLARDGRVPPGLRPRRR